MAKTTSRDLGYKRILKDVAKVKQSKPYVKIGILEAAGIHRDSVQTVAGIGAVHEYGSDDGRIPERSFIRSTMDQNQENLVKLSHRKKDEIIFQKKPVAKALGEMGAIIQGLIQKKIADTDADWPELAEETIARKKSSKPLIDTGQLRQSIRYQVVESGD